MAAGKYIPDENKKLLRYFYSRRIFLFQSEISIPEEDKKIAPVFLFQTDIFIPEQVKKTPPIFFYRAIFIPDERRKNAGAFFLPLPIQNKYHQHPGANTPKALLAHYLPYTGAQSAP